MSAVFASTLAPVEHPVRYYAEQPGAPSIYTILRAIKAGQLAAVRVGTGYQITPAAYSAWMDARRVPVGGASA